MKVWSRMYVVDVQSDSVQYTNWNLINWYTRTTNSFVVVYAVKILKANTVLNSTLRNVAISWDLVMFNLRDDVCLLSHLSNMRFCTVLGLKFHQLVHSDYKQFCCGLCSKDFKRKYGVPISWRHLVLWRPISLMCSWFTQTCGNVCTLLFET